MANRLLRSFLINAGIVGVIFLLAFWNVVAALVVGVIAGAIIESRKPSRVLTAFAMGNVLFPPSDE